MEARVYLLCTNALSDIEDLTSRVLSSQAL
jgi:hypothetical protein